MNVLSRQVLLPLVAALLIGGCASLGLERDEPLGEAEAIRVARTRGWRVRDGVTTRSDVESRLGEPDYATAGGRECAYRWQTIHYDEAVPDFGNVRPPGGVVTHASSTSLLVRFDEANVVTAHRKVKHDYKHGGPPELPDLLARCLPATKE